MVLPSRREESATSTGTLLTSTSAQDDQSPSSGADDKVCAPEICIRLNMSPLALRHVSRSSSLVQGYRALQSKCLLIIDEVIIGLQLTTGRR